LAERISHFIADIDKSKFKAKDKQAIKEQLLKNIPK
jgi:hypothetical protein